MSLESLAIWTSLSNNNATMFPRVIRNFIATCGNSNIAVVAVAERPFFVTHANRSKPVLVFSKLFVVGEYGVFGLKFCACYKEN